MIVELEDLTVFADLSTQRPLRAPGIDGCSGHVYTEESPNFGVAGLKFSVLSVSVPEVGSGIRYGDRLLI